MVLIFNGAQVLVAVTRSLHSAAELTKGNLQAISFCCTGKYVCSGGLYFRHLHPDVEIELADLGTLMRKYPLIPTLWMIFEDSTFAFRSGDKHRSRRIYGK